MTRLVRFSNNAVSRLASNITNVATTISLTPGDGAKFPIISGTQFFMATLIKADGTTEIVKVTARSSDTLTVVRAAEPVGSTQVAYAFTAGDRIEQRLTAKALSDELDRLDSGANIGTANKTANYTVLANDVSNLIRVDTTSGTITVTLPQISSLTDDFDIMVAKVTGDANLLNVVRAGTTDLINGVSSYVINNQWQSVWLIADRSTGTWTAINSGAGSTNVTVDSFTGSGTAGPFTLSGDPASKNNTAVYVGGVYQQKATYTLSGTSLTLGGTVEAGVAVEVLWAKPNPIGVPSDGTVTTLKLADSAVTTLKLAGGAVTDDKVAADAGIQASKLAYLLSGTGSQTTTVDKVLDETVSVLRFLTDDEIQAVQTNVWTTVSDVAASIQKAIDHIYSSTIQGGRLHFPKGFYKVNTSIYQKPRVSFVGDGSRHSTIYWGGASGAGLTYDAVVYCVNGTDASPDFVFSTNIEHLAIGGNNVAPVALAIRGHQENCVFSDLVLGSFTETGLNILPFSSINHGISFEDLHILPSNSASGGTGIKGSHVQKCNFKNITTDIGAGFNYSRGIHLYNTPLLNLFENIHTEDCTYGFYVEGGANNIFIGLEARNGNAAGIAHFYTTSTRYQIHGIRTIGGYTNQLQDSSNTVAAGTDTDSLSIVRGGSYFKRISDTESGSVTLSGRLTRGVDSYAGSSGVGQTNLRINTSIPASGTKYVEIDLGAGAVGFSGKLRLFSTGDQRYATEVLISGYGASDGSVAGGSVSAQVGTNTTALTVSAPSALATPATGKIRIPVLNNSSTLVQALEVLVEITVGGRQAIGISVS